MLSRARKSRIAIESGSENPPEKRRVRQKKNKKKIKSVQKIEFVKSEFQAA